ncbi:MAG: DUF4339 domain-containing protein [Opitutae bacterium]|nr:DUF4339 domain-containing protein [Opitutae bacterium]MBT4665544.1 DUF4339 domain-containing protein [Opitutae bacterium]MBT5909584.1 DUF4339 domain-containing protein [Opitutae bacterium]MBT6852627.1 DUF4339 domain-containing protein [Opitutae bacterium]MBT7741659.1 DUF4339 domain-containing protein [Opitutae bacterium]
MRYYYIDAQGQTLGPVEEAYIRDLRAKGIVNDSTHLNLVGSTDWQSLEELLPAEDPPPPPPPPPRIEDAEPPLSGNLLVERNGQNFGPYSVAEAKQYLEGGELSQTDSACWEGASEWLPLNQLLARAATPSPAPESPRPQLADQYGESSKTSISPAPESPRPQLADQYAGSSKTSTSLDIDGLLADFKQQYEVIYAGNENKNMGEKVFFGSGIPYEKLIGAYAGYAYEAKSNNHINLVLLDDTLSGDSKKGFLATNMGVYFKNMMEKGSFIEWSQIQSIQSKAGFLGSKILINHTQKIEMQPWHGKILASLLEEALRFLRKNTKLLVQGSAPSSTSDPSMASPNQQYHSDLVDIDPEIKQAYSRHFLMLEEMLSEGEMVHAIARGVGGFGKAGKEITAATNKRILVFRQIVNLLMPQFEQEEFYWTDIESIKVVSGMLMSEIVIRTRGGEFAMKNVSSDDAAGFVAFTTGYLQRLKSS